MSGSALSKAWRRSIAASPLLHVCRWLLHRGYPNHKAFALLDSADLPKEVDALIRITVKRSKLWANERAEIARELIAHAQDALEAGRAGQEIASTFGDPKRIAKLMGRSMKRKRPLYWRAYRNMKRATGVLILVLIVGYSSLAVRFYMGKPEIKRNFIAELNARDAGYSEDQKAWGVLHAVYEDWQEWSMLLLDEQMLRPSGDDPAYDGITIGVLSLGMMKPGHPEYQETADLLRSFEPKLHQYREAAKRPILGKPYTFDVSHREPDGGVRMQEVLPSDDPAEQPEFSHLGLGWAGELRHMVNVLAFDAEIASEEGDADRVIENLVAIANLARLSSDQPGIISRLVGLAILEQQCQLVVEIIEQGEVSFGADQMSRLAHSLSAAGGDWGMNLDTERWFFDDFLQRIYTDDGRGGGRITPEGVQRLGGLVGRTGWSENDQGGQLSKVMIGVTGPISMVALGDRLEEQSLYDAMLDKIRRGLAGRPELIAEMRTTHGLIGEQAESGGLGQMFSPAQLISPALADLMDVGYRIRMKGEAVQTLLAIETYRIEHNELPRTLDDLVPQYIPSVPEDFMNPGQGVRYVRFADGYMIYSIGNDGDDDGGADPVATGRLRDEQLISKRFVAPEGIELGLGDPVGPDGDWILIDMRRAGESSSGG